jgi:fido (protein-threonine AMPylation protein)
LAAPFEPVFLFVRSVAHALPRLAWWDTEDTAATLWAGIDAAQQRLNGASAMAMFGRRSLLAFVLVSNRLEGTLPARYVDKAIYQLLEDELDSTQDSEPEEEPKAHWPADGGGSSPETRRQLLQSLKAAKYLCGSPPSKLLSVERICTAHKLLMMGAVEEDGTLLAAGQLRTEPSHSGTGYVYPDAATIPEGLQQIVDEFNAAASAPNAVPTHLAAELLYRFVTLHPFQNGNGRMCRLLAAYAARAAGVPFMLHLSNGRSKASQHYQQVLRHADNHWRDTSRLQSFILECLHFQWQNAVAYAGEGPHACSSALFANRLERTSCVPDRQIGGLPVGMQVSCCLAPE